MNDELVVRKMQKSVNIVDLNGLKKKKLISIKLHDLKLFIQKEQDIEILQIGDIDLIAPSTS